MTNADAVSQVFWAVLAIGIGSIFLLFGIKVFRAAVGLAGFGAFGFGAYILVGQAYGTLGITPPPKDLVRLGISLGAGILGGFVSIWLWKVALLSFGVLGGLGLAVYILSWKSNGLLQKPTHRTILMTILGVAGAFASFFLENALIIITTAIVGSIGLFSGIDVFAKTGFNDAFAALIKNKGTFALNDKSYGMLAACGGTAILGGLIQYALSRKKPQPKTIA